MYFEVADNKVGNPTWRLHSDHGQRVAWAGETFWRTSDNVASSGESFASKSNAERAAANVQSKAGTATAP